MKIKMWSLASVFILSANTAVAHTDEYLDTIAGKHGGQLRMAGPFHFEMVVTPATLQIHVTDHANTAIPVKGATGSATVINGKNKQQITLNESGENLLEGAGRFVPSEPTKAVVKIQLPGQEAQQVLFDTSKHKPATGHQH